jgi:quinol monooxygenase YgiN
MEKVINARIRVKEDGIQQFISLAKVMIEKSNAEPGCLVYQLYQEVGNQTSFIFYEKYINQQAIENHNASAHFKNFIVQITDLLAEKSIIDIF